MLQATISTRGVKISLTRMSLNSMADLIRSLSSSLMVPSFSTSSTITFNSASVMAGFSVLLPETIWLSRIFSCLKSQLRGMNSQVFHHNSLWVASKKDSGNSFARLFGEISPTTSMTMVVTVVAMETLLRSPMRVMHSRVAMDAVPILTMLLPTRIVESTSSKWSMSFKIPTASWFPLRARFLMRILLTVLRAVSEAE